MALSVLTLDAGRIKAVPEAQLGDELAVTTTAVGVTLTESDTVVLCTAAITIDLPAAATVPGKVYYIKSTGSTVTVDADGTETIDGELTQVLGPYDSMLIVSDGTDWWIL